ncbi:NAD(P)/FAD-dependent oxidoreductase [Frankia sp. R82]|uniref:flavin-containing monooxygenase n=1 Tax=Frankia sp. R82 TaxID=2950553 RepID=UPI00204492E5|nr:NAD(P)/FAD-dependent oxidoreductase [Frankia sp. R82]MCM3882351.1 NAD(P)/FAD-dependent oxidoreductase [Frankia sp. R82]
MPSAAAQLEHLDVLIVGAGISGLGAAYYLRREHPQRSHAILEARGALGGTWDLFRYPGIRSDSDLHTFGYAFKPWRGEKFLADGEQILAYLRETAREFDLERDIRYHTKVVSASWSSPDARWTVEVVNTESGARSKLTCSWLLCATGYYRYDEGFTPHFDGRERFRGQIIHPQHWPADLDVTGRRIVVIGSGATAVTLVPALADTAAHVTMLQRTPTYILATPPRDALVIRLRRIFGEKRAHTLARTLYILRQQAMWRFCRRFPKAARRLIRRMNVRMLPAGYAVDEHFRPPYDPWDQRLCFAPGGDLFTAIRRGAVSVVTDRVTTFTENGVLLASGRELTADVIVTATGLNVQAFGGVPLTVDGEPVRLSSTVAYKGLMLSGVPNLAYMVGYTTSSWTLKIGLLCEHFCRLLTHMDTHGYDTACPVVADPDLGTRPFLDFGAGYIQRVLDELPRQGNRKPWLTSFDYLGDVRLLRHLPVADDELRLSHSRQRTGAAS